MCIFQLFQFGVNNNTGVSFTYSEPLAGTAEIKYSNFVMSYSLSLDIICQFLNALKLKNIKSHPPPPQLSSSTLK